MVCPNCSSVRVYSGSRRRADGAVEVYSRCRDCDWRSATRLLSAAQHRDSQTAERLVAKAASSPPYAARQLLARARSIAARLH